MRPRAILAAALLSGVLAPVLLAPPPGYASTTFTQKAMSVVVKGSTVTASATIKSRRAVKVAGFGFCTVDAAGKGLKSLEGKAPRTIRSKGTKHRHTFTFREGTWSVVPCVHNGKWRRVGKAQSFTVGSSSVPADPQPVGVPGRWSLAFEDEFSGTTLDRSKWSPWWFREGARQNGVATSAKNVAVNNGNLVLTLASSTSGASVTTNPAGGASKGYAFTYGYAEARIYFPGSGQRVYNWPAWWIDGQSWPADGENDIAEGLGTMTVNYHSPSGSHNLGTVPGTWAGAFHTYGVNRMPGRADVYFDGVKVKSYRTDDSGSPQYLILNVGEGNTHVYGAGSQLKVDYVRVWRS